MTPANLVAGIPVLAALDVTGNVAFWVDALGFTRDFEVPGFAGISRDGVRLYVSATPDQVVPDNTQAWIAARDLDGLHREWSAHVPAETPDHPRPALTTPAPTPWGTVEMVVRDPAGNCVHVVAETPADA